MNELPVGAKVGGRYTIKAALKTNNSGIKYEATDAYNDDDIVIIKELYPTGSEREGSNVVPPAELSGSLWQQITIRFMREYTLLQQPGGHYIAPILAVFSANNTSYAVMKPVSGPTLTRYVTLSGGHLPEPEAVDYVTQLGQALAQLRADGVEHLNITTADLVRTGNGQIVVTDFFVPSSSLNPFPSANLDTASSDVKILAGFFYYLLSGKSVADGFDNNIASPALTTLLRQGLAYDSEQDPYTPQQFLSELHTAVASLSDEQQDEQTADNSVLPSAANMATPPPSDELANIPLEQYLDTLQAQLLTSSSMSISTALPNLDMDTTPHVDASQLPALESGAYTTPLEPAPASFTPLSPLPVANPPLIPDALEPAEAVYRPLAVPALIYPIASVPPRRANRGVTWLVIAAIVALLIAVAAAAFLLINENPGNNIVTQSRLDVTQTPSPNPTPAARPTLTSVAVAQFTTSPVVGAEATSTPALVHISTQSPTAIVILLPTDTPVLVPDNTSTPTDTPVSTATDTPSPSPTNTPLPPTATRRPTNTPRPRPTRTPRPTKTPTPRPSATPTPTHPPTPTNTPVPPPTATPLPRPTKVVSVCDNIPPSFDATVSPGNCITRGSGFGVIARGFTPGVEVRVWAVAPDKSNIPASAMTSDGSEIRYFADGNGMVVSNDWYVGSGTPSGIWELVFHQLTGTPHESIARFAVK